MKYIYLAIVICFISARGYAAGDPYSTSVYGYTFSTPVGTTQFIKFNVGNGNSADRPILANSVEWTINFPTTILSVGTGYTLPAPFYEYGRTSDATSTSILIRTNASIDYLGNSGDPLAQAFTLNIPVTGTVAGTQGTISINNRVLPGFNGSVGNANAVNDNASSPIVFTPAANNPVLTGTVFNDANGNTVIDNAAENFNASTNLLPAALYVHLVNSGGVVVSSTQVAANGTYTLAPSASQNYTLHLSATQYANGTDSASISKAMPAGWVNTGENSNGNSGPGDLQPNGVLSVSVGSADVNNANFGIEHVPTAVNDNRLNNNYGITVTVAVLGNDTDPAPGNLVPSTVSMIAPGTASDILYDAPGGDMISMNIPGQGTWTVDAVTGAISFTPQKGYVGNPTPIQYTVDDNAGFPSNPATVTITYLNPVSISGNVFNDANGNTVIDNGERFSAVTLALPTQLYVYLVNATSMIMDSARVAADGSYEVQASQNQSYTLKLSAVSYEVGTSPTISTTPPAGWVTTGENGNNNIAPGDGGKDGMLSVATATNNMINKNFGIERPPVVNDVDWFVQNITGNTLYVLGTMTLNAIGENRHMNGTDSDDGRLTSGITLKVVSLPAPAYATLYYDADGSGGNPPATIVAGQQITNYNPANMFVEFLPGTKPSELSFTYDMADAANVYSNTPATYTINMLSILPVNGLVLRGSVGSQHATLVWNTFTETATSYFVVERSTNGATFTEIGRVTASGNSNSQKSYNYQDSTFSRLGTAWYRVRLEGLQGDTHISNIVGLTQGTTAALKIYPNPAKDFVMVTGLGEKADLRLLDVAGKTLRVLREGGNTARVNLVGLAAGMYILQVLENGMVVRSVRVTKE